MALPSLDCNVTRELLRHAAARMRIEITGAGGSSAGGLRADVERRLLLAMSRFGREIHALRASLDEPRNPLGGVDQRCRVRARLRNGLVLRAEAINGRVGAAAARSADRLALLVAAALDGGAGSGSGREPTRLAPRRGPGR